MLGLAITPLASLLWMKHFLRRILKACFCFFFYVLDNFFKPYVTVFYEIVFKIFEKHKFSKKLKKTSKLQKKKEYILHAVTKINAYIYCPLLFQHYEERDVNRKIYCQKQQISPKSFGLLETAANHFCAQQTRNARKVAGGAHTTDAAFY